MNGEIIEHEMPDGTVLEFPANADPAMVQGKVREYIRSLQPTSSGLLSSLAAIPAGIAAFGEDLTSGEPGWQNTGRVADSLLGQLGQGHGARNAAQTMGVSAVAEPVAGLTGIGQGLLGMAPDVQGMKTAMTDAYGGGGGAEEQQAMRSLAGAMKSTDKTLDQYLPGYEVASGTAAEMGNVWNDYADRAAEGIHPAAGAYMQAAPAGLSAMAPFAVPRAAQRAKQAMAPVSRTPEQLIAQQLRAGIPAKGTATKRLTLPGRDFEGKPQPNWRNQEVVTAPSGARGASGPAGVGTDRAAQDVIKQGFDAGDVAAWKSADPVTRRKLNQMLGIVDKVRDNSLAKIRIRPSDVLGDALHNRVRIVRSANIQAGRRLKPQIERLRGIDVDINPAVSKFVQSMDEIGIKIAPGADGKMRVGIAPDSDVAGLPGIQSQVESIVESMSARGKSRAPQIFKMGEGMAWDAKDVHHFKKYIDNLVDWGIGKEKTGVAGSIERIAKNMRHDLNAALGEAAPGYKAVNTKYAETVEVWDALQDILGRKLALDGPQASRGLGRLMKRITSNAQSRERLQGAVDDIERVARKYQPDTSKALVPQGVTAGPGINIQDDLDRMILMVDTIEKRFGSNAANSLQGNLDSAMQRQARNITASRSATEMGAQAGAQAFDRFRGINDDNALKALKDLLKDPNTPNRPNKAWGLLGTR